MQRHRILLSCGVLLLVLGLLAGIGRADESSTYLLTGDTWQVMSSDAKMAYVWGIGNIVAYERELKAKPSPEQRSFLPLLIKGMAGKPMNEIVTRIDAYYAEHPKEVERPVVDALFYAVVLPTIRDQAAKK